MNKRKKQISALALVATMLLSGCGEKSSCEVPTRHVHRYTKEISSDITLEAYFDQEYLTFSGYNWNDDYIEINKMDEEFYKLITGNKLFEGPTNWDYLFNVMANQHDYLKFYYEYYTTETKITTDSEGNETVEEVQVHHDGWTENPYNSDNTGKTRLYHHKFYGYKVVYKNGRFSLEKSPLVDDIREIIDEYPYFSESCVSEVFETFKFSRYELGDLRPEDFNVYSHPDLSNPNLNTEKPYIKTYENK